MEWRGRNRAYNLAGIYNFLLSFTNLLVLWLSCSINLQCCACVEQSDIVSSNALFSHEIIWIPLKVTLARPHICVLYGKKCNIGEGLGKYNRGWVVFHLAVKRFYFWPKMLTTIVCPHTKGPGLNVYNVEFGAGNEMSSQQPQTKFSCKHHCNLQTPYQQGIQFRTKKWLDANTKYGGNHDSRRII